MRLVSATITQNTEIMPKIRLLGLLAPDIAGEVRPGQFIMVNCGEQRVLPRPISIHGTTAAGEVLLLVNIVGKGTEWLAQRQEGDSLQVIGPSGNGFTVSSGAKNLLLVAGGIGIAPLAFLTQQAASTKAVTLLMGATTASLLYPQDRLPQNIHIVRTTDDGSAGHRGLVTGVMPEYLNAADQVFACGPLPMYRSIESLARSTGKAQLVQISLEVRMGCGIGTCYGCSIRTLQGMKKVCKDGPVFSLPDIVLDEVRV